MNGNEPSNGTVDTIGAVAALSKEEKQVHVAPVARALHEAQHAPMDPPSRPSDTRTRKERIGYALAGVTVSLALAGALTALRADTLNEYSQALSGSESEGLVHTNSSTVPHSHFLVFFAISAGVVALGILISRLAFDPIEGRVGRAKKELDAAEVAHEEVAVRHVKNSETLKKLEEESRLLPERLAAIELHNFGHALRDLAKTAADRPDLAGEWSGEPERPKIVPKLDNPLADFAIAKTPRAAESGQDDRQSKT